MAEFIVNPRRAPRAPARCRAAVSSTQGWFEAETEDVGTMGCQLVSPKLVRKGDIVQLHITNEKVQQPLKVSGRVAWVSPQAPWRVGIAFDDSTHKECVRWFDLLLAAYPGLGGYRRIPDRLRSDSSIYLGPPPRFLLDFTRDEAALLRAIGSGARLDELKARLRDRWAVAQRALFSLIARQAITFQRGQAVHPESWKKILYEIEASFAVEEMGRSDGDADALAAPREAPRATPLPSTPTPAVAPLREPEPSSRPGRAGALRASESIWSAAEPNDPSPVADLAAGEGGEALETESTAAAVQRATSWANPRAAGPSPDFDGAGGGWRKARTRPPQAQAIYERALGEIRGGSIASAITLLRLALQLAPGDPDIAAELGKLAFKDRKPGGT